MNTWILIGFIALTDLYKGWIKKKQGTPEAAIKGISCAFFLFWAAGFVGELLGVALA